MSNGTRGPGTGVRFRACRVIAGAVLASAVACDPPTQSDTATSPSASPKSESGALTSENGTATDVATALESTITTTSGSRHSADGTSDGAQQADAALSPSVSDAAVGSVLAQTAESGETSLPSDATDSLVEPSLEAIREQYTSWRTHTEQPVNISAQIFGLCRLPTAAEDDFVESVHGQELYLLDWVNEAAYEVDQMINGAAGAAVLPDAGGVVFPVGSAIVKEKLVLGADGEYALAALGLMVKRAPGFDSATADWEFGYWEPGVGMASGAAENAACGTCHASSRTDFVFLDATWRFEQP